jgi:hypothetical protein
LLQGRLGDDRVQVQRPIEVRELRCARLGRLVAKLGAYSRRIDPEQNEIALTAVERVRGEVSLLG